MVGTLSRVDLLLLHALPFDGTMWDRLPPFECDSVVAPTLYGLGDTIEDWAAAALRLCGQDPLVVVGNSIGGSCALEVARLAPDRVAALVLIGTKAAHHPEPDVCDAAIRFLCEHGVAAGFARYWEPLFGSEADPEIVEAARALATRQVLGDIVRGTSAFHARADREHFARSWSKPLLVVEGAEDQPERGAEIAAMAPRAELCVVEATGHYVPLEQPLRVGDLIFQLLSDLAMW